MNFALLLSCMSLLTGKSQPMTFYEDRSVGPVSPRSDTEAILFRTANFLCQKNYAVTATATKTSVVLMKQQLEKDLEEWGSLSKPFRASLNSTCLLS